MVEGFLNVQFVELRAGVFVIGGGLGAEGLGVVVGVGVALAGVAVEFFLALVHDSPEVAGGVLLFQLRVEVLGFGPGDEVPEG